MTRRRGSGSGGGAEMERGTTCTQHVHGHRHARVLLLSDLSSRHFLNSKDSGNSKDMAKDMAGNKSYGGQTKIPPNQSIASSASPPPPPAQVGPKTSPSPSKITISAFICHAGLHPRIAIQLTMAATLRHLLLHVCIIPLFVVHTFHIHSTVSFSHHPSYINSVLNPDGGDASSPRVSKTKPKQHRQQQRKEITTKNRTDLETWRIFGIDVDPDALGTSVTTRNVAETDNSIPSPDRSYLSPPVLASLLSRLRIKSDTVASSINDDESIIVLPPQLKDARVVRRSIDARRRRGAPPKYSYVIDVTLSKEVASHQLKLSHQPGRMERLVIQKDRINDTTKEGILLPITNHGIESNTKQKIIIVGAGPAGLFCALSLASSGLFTPIVLERGTPVEARGKSIGALIHRRSIDPESNFSFGEGGAGNLFMCSFELN